jgi:hypothetical protein
VVVRQDHQIPIVNPASHRSEQRRVHFVRARRVRAAFPRHPSAALRGEFLLLPELSGPAGDSLQPTVTQIEEDVFDSFLRQQNAGGVVVGGEDVEDRQIRPQQSLGDLVVQYLIEADRLFEVRDRRPTVADQEVDIGSGLSVRERFSTRSADGRALRPRCRG